MGRPRKSSHVLRLNPIDICERRAYIRLPPEAKLRLAKHAGAPWNEIDPGAELGEEQKALIARPERTKVVEGGSGLGKSLIAGIEGGCDFLIPFKMVGYIGDTFDHVGKEFAYFEKFVLGAFKNKRGCFTRAVNISQHNRHEYHFESIWKSEGRGYSMDHREGGAVLGKSLDRAILCEGSQISISVLNRRVLRATDRAVRVRKGYPYARESGFVSAYTTPDSLEGAAAELLEQNVRSTNGELEKLRYRRVGFVRSFFHTTASSTWNPSFSPEVMAHRGASMTEHEFAEVYKGISNARAGRVYSEFNERRHKLPMPSPAVLRTMRFGVGTDTGANFAFLLLGVDRHRRLWVLGEVYTRGEATRESFDQVRAMLLRVLGPIGYKDMDAIAERVDLAIYDKTSQFKADLAAGLPFTFSSPYRDEGQFEKLPTILQMKAIMGDDRVLVVDECFWTLDELRKYIWAEQKSPTRKGRYFTREPIKDHDHAMDAMRYGGIPLLQMGPINELTEHQDGVAESPTRALAKRMFIELRAEMDEGQRAYEEAVQRELGGEMPWLE